MFYRIKISKVINPVLRSIPKEASLRLSPKGYNFYLIKSLEYRFTEVEDSAKAVSFNPIMNLIEETFEDALESFEETAESFGNAYESF